MSALRIGVSATTTKEGFGVADRDDDLVCVTVTTRPMVRSVLVAKADMYDLVAQWVMGKPELLARIKAEIELQQTQ